MYIKEWDKRKTEKLIVYIKEWDKYTHHPHLILDWGYTPALLKETHHFLM